MASLSSLILLLKELLILLLFLQHITVLFKITFVYIFFFFTLLACPVIVMTIMH